MYLLELIAKTFFKKKEPIENTTKEEIEKCSHVFLPIDSSGEYLACNKCGFLVNKPKNQENFFQKFTKKS